MERGRLISYLSASPKLSGLIGFLVGTALAIIVSIIELKTRFNFNRYNDPHAIALTFFMLAYFAGSLGVGSVTGITVAWIMRRNLDQRLP